MSAGSNPAFSRKGVVAEWSKAASRKAGDINSRKGLSGSFVPARFDVRGVD
jgi:hypothetical protein